MRTTEQKAREIMVREKRIRAGRGRRRQIGCTAAASAASLVLIIYASFLLPQYTQQAENAQGDPYFGIVLAQSPVAGMIVIAVLSFTLGVCVTLLATALGRHSGGRGKR